jgi:hypothetical protein
MAGSVPSTYFESGFIALNPTATNAYVFGTLNTSPYPVYLLQCLLNQTVCQKIATVVASAPGAGFVPQGGMTVNGNYVFWGYGSLSKFEIATSITTTFASNAYYVPVLDSNNVYWVGPPGQTIYALPQTFMPTSVPVNLGSFTSPTIVAGIASDGTNLYYGTANNSASATLSYVLVGGGSATVLYNSSGTLGAGEKVVTYAAGALYWVDEDDNACPPKSTIMGVATP